MNGSTSSFMPLTWLFNRLADKRDHLLKLLRHMTALGTRGAMAPNVFGRFLNLLDQISAERQDENRIMDRIADVEAQHRQRRQQHQLIPAEIAARGDFIMPAEADQGVDPKAVKRRRLFWLMMADLANRLRIK